MKKARQIKIISSILMLLFIFIFGSIQQISLPEGTNIRGGIFKDEIVDNSDDFSRNLKTSVIEFGLTEVVSTESIGNSFRPTIAVDDAGNVHVAWHDNTNYDNSGEDPDIFYKRWDAFRRRWTTIEVISTESTVNSYEPIFVVDDAENVHMVWCDYTNIDNS